MVVVHILHVNVVVASTSVVLVHVLSRVDEIKCVLYLKLHFKMYYLFGTQVKYFKNTNGVQVPYPAQYKYSQFSVH